MSTLTTFNSERERLKVMTMEYMMEEDGHRVPEPIVQLFCRDAEGNRRYVEVEGFYPYFYIGEQEFRRKQDDLLNEGAIRSIVAHERLVKDEHSMNVTIEKVTDAPARTLHGQSLVKIETVRPNHVKDLRDFFDETWEADVFFTNRFLVTSGVKRGVEIPAGAERVHYDDINATEDLPDIDPRMVTIDIEVYTGGVFPDTEEARMPITSYTLHDTYDDEYKAAILHPSATPYGPESGEEIQPWDEPQVWESDDVDWELPDGVDDSQIEIDVYHNEAQMLGDANEWIIDKNPDLLTGWNSSRNDIGNGFDYPYWINRCKAINEWSFAELSPLNQTFTTRSGTPIIKGREMFDMLQAYKKTQIHEKRSYALGYIAEEELGYGKEDIESLDEGWLFNPQEFMKYNIRDVEAVVKIEESKGVLDMYDHIRHVTGTPYSECADSNIGIIDILFLRQAYNKGYALPTSTKPERGWYYGGKVFNPVPGKHTNVVYPDLASLYPYLMWSLNVSPETVFDSLEEAEDAGYTEDDLYKAYVDRRDDDVKKDSDPVHSEIYYTKPDVKEGFVREVVTDMTDMKYEYKKDQYSDEKYDAVKRIVNSLYGVFGDSASYGKGFRLFDWRLAETVTLAGQEVLKYTSMTFEEFLNDNGYPDAKRVGGDSVPANEPTLINRGNGPEIIPIEDVSVGDMVWSHNGWTRVNDVIKKPNRKKLYTVQTKSGISHVTEDHSLVRDTMEEVTPKDVSKDDELLHNDISSVDVEELDFNERRAWLLGLFAAEGSCGVYECESGSKASWAINNSERSVLEEAKEIMESVFGIRTKVDNVMESSNTMKLRLHENVDNASTVLGFREMLYSGTEKRVPKEILQATEDSKNAFLAGYHTGDGHIAHDSKEFDEMWTKHTHLASGIVFLLRQTGHNVTLSVRTEQKDEYYRIRNVSFHQGSNTAVRKIEEYEYDGDYVYDLETESHHFQSGIGSMIVHNTDSVMTTIPSLDVTAEEIQEDFIAMQEGKEPEMPFFQAAQYVNESYDEFMAERFWIDDPDMHKMEVEIESYADSLFFLRDFKSNDPNKGVKKRYSQLITWDEGEVIDNPEPATKGFELVRSDTSEITGEVQEGVLHRILKEDDPESSVASYLKENWDATIKGDMDPAKIGIPSAISKPLEEYGGPNKNGNYQTPQPHIRGAKWANAHVSGENIRSGDKPLMFYVERVAHPYPDIYVYTQDWDRSMDVPSDATQLELGKDMDAIALNDVRNLPKEVRIDYEKMANKTLRRPIEPIVKTMGWDFTNMVADSSQNSLADYM